MFKPLSLSAILRRGLLLAGVCFPYLAAAQKGFNGLENLFTPPLNYKVHYTYTRPDIDGSLNDLVWQQAAWTTTFKDIEGKLKPNPTYRTEVKMLWGDSCLYIAARLQEPHIWAILKQHDDIIFNDNDFEVFIDPGNRTHQYFEFEVNALNTLFDLFLNKPYRNKGNAMINWNSEGFKSAVKIQGTLNNPTDLDEGWTVEMAIPFKSLSLGNTVKIPADGDLWRINFSRVEWDTHVVNGQYVRATDKAGKRLPEHNWVWSAQGVVNMHYPERWGYLQFVKQPNDTTAFVLPHAEKLKQYLWLIYYRQQKYFDVHRRYAPSLSVLGISNAPKVDGTANQLSIEATAHQFVGMIADSAANFYWAINR